MYEPKYVVFNLLYVYGPKYVVLTCHFYFKIYLSFTDM
jgi:hypothetical protein